VVKPTPRTPPRSAVKTVRRRSPNAVFYAALGLVALVGLGALGYVASRGDPRQVVTLDPNLPPVQSGGYVLGSSSAPVEVVEFADFECPACAQFALLHEPDVRKRLIETGQVRLRFLDMPLVEIGHRNSPTASLAAACANEQGKFWEMHDALFANQDHWHTPETSDPRKVIDPLARQLGLDMTRYEQCMNSRKYLANIQAHRRTAEQYQVTSTPSFLIGGKVYAGSLPYDEFKRTVDQARASGASNPTLAAPAVGSPAAGTSASAGANLPAAAQSPPPAQGAPARAPSPAKTPR
jgi:protein-disulfide isomerase